MYERKFKEKELKTKMYCEEVRSYLPWCGLVLEEKHVGLVMEEKTEIRTKQTETEVKGNTNILGNCRGTIMSYAYYFRRD